MSSSLDILSPCFNFSEMCVEWILQIGGLPMAVSLCVNRSLLMQPKRVGYPGLLFCILLLLFEYACLFFYIVYESG